MKSAEEVLSRLRELVRRYRRRYIRRNLRSCPVNCKMAELLGREVVGCPACHSRNPEFCKDEARFIPFFSKQELVDQFNRMLRDPQVLLHDYRDIVAFLFVLGAFDEPRSVPENIIQGKEGR